MSDKVYDIAVIGLGAYGSSIFYHAAQSGLQVLGIEQFDSPHSMGSSHGDTRITRQAYYEDPIYVPIAAKSQTMVKELQEKLGERLYDEIGAIYFGPIKEELIDGVKQSIKLHNLPHKIYDSESVTSRFPSVKIPKGYELIYEPNAGILYPEKIIKVFLDLGAKNGNARLQKLTKFLRYEDGREDGNIKIYTDCGEFYTKKLVLSQGIWNHPHIQRLGVKYKIVKQSVSWFEMEDREKVSPQNFPVFLGQNDAGRFIYGFPDLGQGLKTAIHDFGEEHQISNNTDNLNRNFDKNIQAETREYLKLFLNQSIKSVNKESTCFYTILPQGDFLIDFLPNQKNIILVSCCSGHGFKFSPSLGQDILKMLQTGDHIHDRFRIKNPFYHSKL